MSKGHSDVRHHPLMIKAQAAVVVTLALLTLAVPVFSQEEEGSTDEEIPLRIWAVGIHANLPFLGISFRHWLSDTMGLELNLAPIPGCEYPEPVRPPGPPEEFEPPPHPECPNSLELHLSGRWLLKVSDNPREDFYLTGGPALTLKFTQGRAVEVEASMFALLGEIEIANWPIERLNPVIDYGFALNLQNLYDFRWIAGGVGFHFYF